MAPSTASEFDFNSLSFGATTMPTRAGGKCVRVGYGPTAAQVEFQLGTSCADTLICAWGAEFAARDDPTSGMVMKVELDQSTRAFLQRLDDATLQAAQTNSVAWFARPTPTHVHNSSIKQQASLPDGGARPDVVKIKLKEDGNRKTEVYVSQRLGENSYSDLVPGMLSDIVKGSRVMVHCRIQGGVYFVSKTFGVSLEAVRVCVVRDEAGQNAGAADLFNYGDCIMVKADGGDADDADSLPC